MSRDDNIIKALAGGTSAHAVANTFGISALKVRNIAASNGIILDDAGHAKDTPALHAAADGHPVAADDTDVTALIRRGAGHPVKRIAAKAARITALVAELDADLRAEAERDLARARVRKLEAELRAAKSLIRGDRRTAAQRQRLPGDVPCPDCDNKFATAQAVNLHRHRAHGHRKQVNA